MYPRNMVCFRYIIVNTLHKGDSKYNNNNKLELIIITIIDVICTD
jgi:hypothetical protein